MVAAQDVPAYTAGVGSLVQTLGLGAFIALFFLGIVAFLAWLFREGINKRLAIANPVAAHLQAMAEQARTFSEQRYNALQEERRQDNLECARRIEALEREVKDARARDEIREQQRRDDFDQQRVNQVSAEFYGSLIRKIEEQHPTLVAALIPGREPKS